MTFLERFRKWTNRNLAVTDEKAWDKMLWNLPGSQSLSGEVVTESTALTYSAVWNAVNLIAGTIGTLPLHLMQEKDGKRRVAEDHSLYKILHYEVNQYMTSMTFREVMMAHVLTWGNGYAEIVRNGFGEVVALWPITPNRVRIESKGSKLYYVVQVDNEHIPISYEKILHIKGLGYDGFVGYSPVAMARKSIGLGMALETFGSNYFGRGTHPGLVVSHPGQLSPQASDNLSTSLAKEYSGLGKSHRLLLLEEGMKVEKVNIPPNDSQFLESRQFQITDVARWFNLPVHKLKEMTKSSFNNIYQEQISFVTDSILPWVVRLEASYNMQLLTAGDKGLYGRGRLYSKHILEGLLRGDAKSRGEFYSKMFSIGAMSPNEIRGKEDMDPFEGGDIRLVPSNMITVENAVKLGLPVLPDPSKGNGKVVEDEETGKEGDEDVISA